MSPQVWLSSPTSHIDTTTLISAKKLTQSIRIWIPYVPATDDIITCKTTSRWVITIKTGCIWMTLAKPSMCSKSAMPIVCIEQCLPMPSVLSSVNMFFWNYKRQLRQYDNTIIDRTPADTPADTPWHENRIADGAPVRHCIDLTLTGVDRAVNDLSFCSSFNIHYSPSDGHCFMHYFSHSLKSQLSLSNEMNDIFVLNCLKTETEKCRRIQALYEHCFFCMFGKSNEWLHTP